MAKLEIDDIQGIIISGYGHLPCSHYLFLQIINAEKTRNWLQKLTNAEETRDWLQELTLTTSNWVQQDGKFKKPDYAVNIAFTYTGLKKLGLPDTSLNTFPNEFIEGMANPDRSRQLGDVGHNALTNWDVHWQRDFSQDDNPEQQVHILLILQHSDCCKLQRLTDCHRQQFEVSGAAKVIAVEEGYIPKDGKEHFGFRDAISQPEIEGRPRMSGRSQDVTKPGEFILGYPNELSTPEKVHLPPTPVVLTQECKLAKEHLKPVEYHNNAVLDLRDLGRNGSYLVFRKLYQDVEKFENYFKDQFPNAEETQKLMQAKMVGRWQSGVPLALAPGHDPCPQKDKDNSEANCPVPDRNYPPADTVNDPDSNQCKDSPPQVRQDGGSGSVNITPINSPCPEWEDKLNHFNYRDIDPLGHRCPIGAHIRRANPRDALGDTAEDAIKSVKRHRLMRRGALYKQDNGDKGILFLCINADIRRQFEFVQQSWIHSDKFNGLYGERDPLIGTRDPETCQMTIPQAPFQQKMMHLPDFVQLKGGDYFFLPSISAINFLANLSE